MWNYTWLIWPQNPYYSIRNFISQCHHAGWLFNILSKVHIWNSVGMENNASSRGCNYPNGPFTTSGPFWTLHKSVITLHWASTKKVTPSNVEVVELFQVYILAGAAMHIFFFILYSVMHDLAWSIQSWYWRMETFLQKLQRSR